MPYKDREDESTYKKGYNRGYRKAIIDFLGGKCKCGETSYYQLEIHHLNGLEQPHRNITDYKKILMGEEEAELMCKKCHPDTDNWRKRNG
jgi:hypothetical protein